MNILKSTTKSIRREKQNLPKAIACPCGSTIACKGSMYRHLKTKRHQRFVETGLPAPKDQAEYSRRMYASNPERREAHKKLCQSYYQRNKAEIYQRHRRNLFAKRENENGQRRDLEGRPSPSAPNSPQGKH